MDHTFSAFTKHSEKLTFYTLIRTRKNVSFTENIAYVLVDDQWTGFYMIETSVMKELELS